MDWTLLRALALGLGLGLLVGLQREWAHREVAGIRTFPMITLLGVLAGTFAASWGGWIVAAGLLALTALLVLANLLAVRGGTSPDLGLTTEAAALVMYGVGALLTLGHEVEGVVVAGVLAVLLQAKAPLHGMVRALSDQDVRAIFRFVLVALVVLPLLPDRSYGPYRVLNPHQIWLMVVLIVGISTAAWGASRLLGPRRGTALTGLLGGLISSTATTVSEARRARQAPGGAPAGAFVVLMASAAAFGRVILEIGVVARGAFPTLAPPLAVVMLVLLGAALLQWRRGVRVAGGEVEAPSDLRTAIAFGLLYALVLVAVAWARRQLGTAGLYGVAGLSGLTDVDAITLSTAQLVNAGSLVADTAWRAVLVAGLANVAFKGGVVLLLGGRALRRPVLIGFAAALAAGTVVLATWP